jgi:hypothetical protein
MSFWLQIEVEMVIAEVTALGVSVETPVWALCSSRPKLDPPVKVVKTRIRDSSFHNFAQI